METTHSKNTNFAAKVSLAAGVLSFFFLFPAVYLGSYFEVQPGLIAGAGPVYLICGVPAGEFIAVTGISAGIVALRQIKQTGRRGTWAAVTGLVFGCMGMAIVLFVYGSKYMAAWL